MIKFLKKIVRYFRLIKSTNNICNLKKGKNLIVGNNSLIYPSKFIEIGDNVFIGRYVTLSASESGNSKIIIGDNVMLAERVLVLGGNHEFSRIDIPINQQGEGKQGDIIINSDVWIGAGSIILTGVEIGEGSIIGAGSVVTKSIPKYSIAVGNPARIIKNRI